MPIAFAAYIDTKVGRYMLALLILPTYLYTINFVANNTFPVTDLTPYY